MTEDDYKRYLEAFNRADYDAMMAFFTEDVVWEVSGFTLRGRDTLRKFYGFFHEYCRETATLKRFYESEEAAVADVVIRFEGLQDLTPDLLRQHATDRMMLLHKGSVCDIEFFNMYHLRPDGLIQRVRAATFEPAPE